MLFNSLVVILAALFMQQNNSANRDPERKLVRLLSAESAQLIDRDGVSYRKVTGPAQFLHNDTYIFCDSAIWNIEQNIIDAMGNVRVIQNETILYSDKIHYAADSSLIKIRGKLVELVDKEKNRLRTHYLDYYTQDSLAKFFNGGSMINSDGGQIESLEGEYDSKIEYFKFLKEVEMKSDSTIIKADSLAYQSQTDIAYFLGKTNIWQDTLFIKANGGMYNRPSEQYLFTKEAYILSNEKEVWADHIFYDKKGAFSDLTKNIQITDTLQKVTFFGDKGKFIQEPLNVSLTDNASLAYYSNGENGADTLFLSADTLKYYTKTIKELDTSTVKSMLERKLQSRKDPLSQLIANLTKIEESALTDSDSTLLAIPPDTTTVRFAFAYHNVKIFKNDMQAKSDSLIFNSLDSIAILYKNPVMWNEGSQFTADSMQFVILNGELHKAELMANTYYISQEDSLYFNQVKSTDMTGFFTDNTLSRFDAFGGASLLFFLSEDSVVTMMNEKECKFLTAAIDSGRISRIKYYDAITSNIYPLVKIEKGKDRLKGFIWREAERPVTRFDICNRNIRETEREAVSKIEKPLFVRTKRFFPEEGESKLPDI